MGTISGIVKDASGNAAAGRIVRAYRRDTGAFLNQTVSSDGVTPGDAQFSNVELLLHCNGAHGSTTFADASTRSRNTAANGNAQITNEQFIFGGASANFDGSGDYLSLEPAQGFSFGADDFTVELWCRPTNASAGSNIFGNLYQTLITQSQFGSPANASFAISLFNLRPNATLFQNASTNPGSITASNAIALNTWSHIAYVRSGSTCNLFVNGVSVGSASVSGATDTSTRPLCIGADSVANCFFQGQLDEVRITKGVARYTADFAVPSGSFLDNSAPISAGAYAIDISFSGECNVVCLDDAVGTTYNDLILRTTV